MVGFGWIFWSTGGFEVAFLTSGNMLYLDAITSLTKFCDLVCSWGMPRQGWLSPGRIYSQELLVRPLLVGLVTDIGDID